MSKEEQTQREQAQFSQSRNEKPWPRGDDEHMSQYHALTINVNAQCAIDAGNWKECVEEDHTPYRLVSPSHTTMYRQVLSYLEETTRNEKVPPTSQLHFGEVAIATVALCIRWGSYFAVLTNRDLPQWASALDPQVSCIGDGEMARINIEASAPSPTGSTSCGQTSHGSANWSKPPSNSCLSPSRSSTGRRIITASGRLAPSIPPMADAT